MCQKSREDESQEGLKKHINELVEIATENSWDDNVFKEVASSQGSNWPE